jgi:hypothetical protein
MFRQSKVQALRFVSGSVSAPSFGILSPSDVEHPVRRPLMDLLMTVPVSKTAGTWARFTRLGGSRHKLSIPLRLHRILENWIDEDDDDHEIDPRHLLGGAPRAGVKLTNRGNAAPSQPAPPVAARLARLSLPK